ncbi:MAG TPA: MlaD family protein [Solirubrobacteraceae bacterium]|jgi:phospholipid/cholesterol/gamma-HCH transport system substrate-binding protein|nr:MlaD family protein [Solirubrobacteraceae bacterium]
MATTTPPPPPVRGPLPPSGEGGPQPLRPATPPPRGVGRWVAVGVLALVVAALAYIVFAGGGGASYKFEIENASQLVLGDQVEVGGVPVGSVTAIALTHDYKALVTFHVSGSLVPLHRGTTVQVRVPSLTTVAGRYVALSPGPNNAPVLSAGATLPSSAAKGTTDLDQLLDSLNPATRKGLQEWFVGESEISAGAEAALSLDVEYFGPFLGSANHIFAELTKDQRTFQNFLVYGARALTTLATHREELTGFVDNGNRAMEALGAEQAALQKGVAELPSALRQGNHAFTQLPSTLAALRKLAAVAGPDTKSLAPLFARLRPLVREAGPVLHNLSVAISKPGPGNDLTDFALALPTLAGELATGSPADVKALQESTPVTAFFGPYAPDLEGFVRTFGTSAGYYDANGQYARISAVFNNFKLGANNALTPVTSAQEGLQGLRTRELRRCPGAGATPSPADGSAPFTDEGKLDCDPTQVP